MVILWMTKLDVYGQNTEPCATPASPVILGSTSAICRGESAHLSATGCAGTVIWSTGETGNRITVQPQQTTRYTALCRVPPGCVSCFAEVWTVTVNTPVPPIITPSASTVCKGDQVMLTATGCRGTVAWPDGNTDNAIQILVNQTITFAGAICTEKGCSSVGSVPIEIAVGEPVRPLVSVDRAAVCAGQSVELVATQCLGVVQWSDGGTGMNRRVTPSQSRSFRAVCRIGSCQSDSSETVRVTVNASGLRPTVATTALTNGCPYQTADLTHAVPTDRALNPAGVWLFRTASDPNAPAVQSPMAVEAGIYYVFLRTSDGCYSQPVSITAIITPCKNGITPCISNPARVIVWTDSLNRERGSVALHTQLRGMASLPQWSGSGTGLFTSPEATSTRYLFSESDRQRGVVQLTLSTADPDGGGPCAGASASVTVAVPTTSNSIVEVVGLSKKVMEPAWLLNGEVELTYRLTVKNLGQHILNNVQVVDDLDAVFGGSGATIQALAVRADSGWAMNPAYTGRGADTTLLIAGTNLPAGSQRSMQMVVRLNVGQANTLTFSNLAHVWAIDKNGGTCRDVSTNGSDPDPDKNGNPGDNNEPTTITLHSVGNESTVFIPEGFSPNGDGINDRFVVSRVPIGTTVRLRVFNRWGNAVFSSDNYQNDWNGTAGVGVASGETRQGLPEGTYFYVVSLSDGREYSRFMTISR